MPEPTETFTRHRPWLYRLLCRLSGDAGLAQDLVQETFVKAVSRGGPRSPAKTRAWLAAIAVNAARDAGRKAARLSESTSDDLVSRASIDESPNPQDALLKSEMDVCIAEYIDRLPQAQRRVVALHDLFGLTHAEVADRLAISEANSRVLLHRGRSALRTLLSEACVLEFSDGTAPCERKPPASR